LRNGGTLITMERGSFLYAADGRLIVRVPGVESREAIGPEWREAAVAMNPALDNSAIAHCAPLYVSQLLVPPEDR
jgi:hypothetical protein